MLTQTTTDRVENADQFSTHVLRDALVDTASPQDAEPQLLSTAHGFFIEPSPYPGHPPIARILRGVNLSSSSKFPTFAPPLHDTLPQQGSTRELRDATRESALGFRTDIPAQNADGIWDEAECGGRDGWFVNRPLHEEWADLHFRRLQTWGYTMIRWIVPWEALEHAGPGKYDEAYIDYTIRLLRKAKDHNFRVFVSPHQDVFSRFTGGSGAPYWAVEATGINPRRVHQTGSAVVHSQWSTEGWGGEEGRKAASKGDLGDFPDMIWNTNTGRLAARHCFTMFYASDVFAPKCQIDGQPVSKFLQTHYNNAYKYLAQRIKEAGGLLDSCLVGWDSINEPDPGLIGIPNLHEFPPSQEFRKGPSPTPIQSFHLALGRKVDDIQDADFGSLGLKKKGTLTITPPDGMEMWMSELEVRNAENRWGWKWGEDWDFWDASGRGGCPWAGHGVWDPEMGDVHLPDYFFQHDGKEIDFIERFWKPHFADMIKGIREHHPNAISFINPPIFKEPPQLSQELTLGRVALSAHFYDGLTMLGKRRHLFNADAVGIQRGHIPIFKGIKLGNSNIRDSLRNQLAELASDASKQEGMAGQKDMHNYPMIVGELGTPWDMKHENIFMGLAKGKMKADDHREPAKAMDQLLNACDGENALSYTLWAYEPLNFREYRDGWNGEDLSLFSFSDIQGDDDLLALDPPDLCTLTRLGARGIESWCRPYPVSFHGRVERFDFTMKTGEFYLNLHVPALNDDPLYHHSLNGSISSATSEEQGQYKSAQPACTTIYLPYVHYVATHGLPSTTEMQGENDRRVVGEPDAEGQEWIKGQGAARVDVQVLELSEGKLEIVGQWARWFYPLKVDEGRTIRLGLRPWKGV